MKDALSSKLVSAGAVFEVMRSRFTSLNPIAVERAYIKREEWEALLCAIEQPMKLFFVGTADGDPDEEDPAVYAEFVKALEAVCP